jgi:hypothetical protein
MTNSRFYSEVLGVLMAPRYKNFTLVTQSGPAMNDASEVLKSGKSHNPKLETTKND